MWFSHSLSVPTPFRLRLAISSAGDVTYFTGTCHHQRFLTAFSILLASSFVQVAFHSIR